MAEEKEPTAVDDGLTEAERKFMDSRGETGLPEEEPKPAEAAPAPPPPPEPPPAPAPAEPPAAVPPATAEADADDDEEPPVDPRTGKREPRQVNFNKFKRLQNDYDAQSKQLTEMRDMMTRADERMKIINDALAPKTDEQQEEAQQDPKPDPSRDIFGYLAWQEREMGRMQERYDQQLSQVRDHVQTREQADQIVNAYKQAAYTFAQAQPAFTDAYNFVVGQRAAELEAMGYRDKVDRDRMLMEEEFGQVRAALEARTNPAERIYNLAVARGFRPGAAPSPPKGATPAPAAAPPPTAAAGTVPAPAQPDVAAIIEAVTNGQSAAQSLSRGGGSPADQLTAEVLANMSQDDFGHVVDRLSKSRLKELMGG